MPELEVALVKVRKGQSQFPGPDYIGYVWRGIKSLFEKPQRTMTLKEFLQEIQGPRITPYNDLSLELKTKVDALKKKFPDYTNWAYCAEGNIKTVFVAESVFDGSGNNLRLAVKMDKPEGEIMLNNPSPAMLKHFRKGYNARREANMALNLQRMPGFSAPIACKELSDVGYAGSYAYAETFIPSVSLQDILDQKEKVPLPIASSFAEQMFSSAQRFRQKTGHLHRDLKPSNVLVSLEDRLGEIVITDTSAAGVDGEVVDSYTHSCPGRTTCDPRLMSSRTGKPSHYDEASEVYSLTKMFGMMLLGKDFLIVDPYSPEHLDVNQYESQLNKALSKLPKNARKFRDLLYHGLTLGSSRINNLGKLLEKFEEASSPSFWEKPSSPRNTVAAAASALAISALGYYAHLDNAKLKDAEKQLNDKERTIEINSDWDGNNNLQPSALYELSTWAVAPGQRYPEKTSILHLQQGDEVRVFANIIQKPLQSKQFRVPYLIYPIEVAVEGNTNISPEIFNTSSRDPKLVPPKNLPFGSGYPSSTTIKIPTNFPSGNYTLLVDSLPPRAANPKDEGEFIINCNTNNILAQQRIPIVVGDIPNRHARITGLRFSYGDNDVGVSTYIHTNGIFEEERTYHLNEKGDLSATYSIPELGFSETNKYIHYIPLPGNETPHGEYTLLIDLINNKTGETNFSTAYPIYHGTNNNGYKLLDWNISVPSQDFAEKVIEYRSREQ
ncbi:MAG: hypothetical protein Q8Q31_00500 [Nanoarchaeota archaeon]|nr:hypothetical protein [Nanoarchaeota archaeon]